MVNPIPYGGYVSVSSSKQTPMAGSDSNALQREWSTTPRYLLLLLLPVEVEKQATTFANDISQTGLLK